MEFVCGSCSGRHDDDSKIVVNPQSRDDMIRLGGWLMTHSASGGVYRNVPVMTPERRAEFEARAKNIEENMTTLRLELEHIQKWLKM